jgi:ankyrin repeat protein
VSSGRPLVRAAQHSNIEGMRCLLNDLGADVNQADEIDSTPLLIAAQMRHLSIVR